jgi:hypothetical protein
MDEVTLLAIKDSDDEALIGYLLATIAEIGLRAARTHIRPWAAKVARAYRKQGSAELSVGLCVINEAWQNL